MKNNLIVNILLIEDSPGDIELTKEAFASWEIPHHLEVVNDGEMAIQFLHKKGKYADKESPNFIILDLNLPRKDGIEVLKELREDMTLNEIPIVILSTSNAESDIKKCYDLGAYSYFVKPVDLDNFYDIIKSIEDLWLYGHKESPSKE
jgi:chemotaxis family two-component system response regulator Rcp1